MDFVIRDEVYRTLLGMLPVKVIALSPNGTAAVLAYDRYWTENGYRSVYFSFEIEGGEGEDAF